MSIKALLSVLGALSLLGCQGKVQERTAAKAEPSASVPLVPDVAPLEVRPAAATHSLTPLAPAPPEALGEWLKSPLYEFRVLSVAPCSAPASAPPGSRSRVRLGVTIEVAATGDQVLASPTAVTLESRGSVFRAELDPPPVGGCAPLLTPQKLRREQSVSGVVVFELPDASYARSATIAYHPPRWGGAPRLALRLSELGE